MEVTKVTYSQYITIENSRLVLVSRRITEGYYDRPEVVDKIVGCLIDILV